MFYNLPLQIYKIETTLQYEIAPLTPPNVGTYENQGDLETFLSYLKIVYLFVFFSLFYKTELEHRSTILKKADFIVQNCTFDTL